MSFGIIIKDYSHYNRALGKYISTKKQYFNELKRQGFVSYEEGCRLAEKKSGESKWIPSKELRNKLNYLKDKCDSKGNIRHPNDLISLYKDSGIKFELPNWLPKHYQEGSFNAT